MVQQRQNNGSSWVVLLALAAVAWYWMKNKTTTALTLGSGMLSVALHSASMSGLPSDIVQGSPMTVDCTITNLSTQAGKPVSYNFGLKVEIAVGSLVNSSSPVVWVAPGGTQTASLSFDIWPDALGPGVATATLYDTDFVTILGTAQVPFTVNPAPVIPAGQVAF